MQWISRLMWRDGRTDETVAYLMPWSEREAASRIWKLTLGNFSQHKIFILERREGMYVRHSGLLTADMVGRP